MDGIKFNGDKLFHIRRSKKISQEQLALGVGVSRQTIYSWETNQSLPDVEKISKICKILEINLSDIVDGVSEKKENEEANQNVKENEDIIVKKKKNKKIIKIISIFMILIILVYLSNSSIKFIKIKQILNKWEGLEKLDSYYIKIQDFSIDRANNKNDVFENTFCERYYHDNILKIVWKDAMEKNIINIIIFDYNEQFKYIVNEKSMTYSKSKLLSDSEVISLTENFNDYIDFRISFFNIYAYCLNPNFNIQNEKDVYEVVLKNKVRKRFNKENGLLEYEESVDNAYRQTRKYYEYELNTDKDFEINLEEYTEVLP